MTGFITQLPLPAGIDENAVLELIAPDEGRRWAIPMNLGRLVLGVDPISTVAAPIPCTPAGILELLAGREVVVIGRGLTVGRPLGLLLTRKGLDATVTMAHSRTRDLATIVRRGDIAVAAIRAPHAVKPGWIKPGAVVLDVGVTRVGRTSNGGASWRAMSIHRWPKSQGGCHQTQMVWGP